MVTVKECASVWVNLPRKALHCHLPTIQVRPNLFERVSHSFCLRQWESKMQGCFSV